MKKNLLKSLLISLVLVLCLVLVGCKKKGTTIGILQLVTHPALDLAREGFVESLAEAGFVDGENVTIIVKNPEGDKTSCGLMADSLIRQCDLVLGIATDAAVALQTASKNEGINIPILFTAVTDPLGEGLVTTLEEPGHNITGVSDLNPVVEQVELIKTILPDASKMGIIYDIGQNNSIVQADIAKETAEKAGLTVEIVTVTDVAGIGPAITNLVNRGIEALYVPTDNTLAPNIPLLVQATEPKKVLMVCGESSPLIAGGSITFGISYKELGLKTGKMAVRILNKEITPATTPVEFITENLELAINEASFNRLGITIPQSILDRNPTRITEE